MSQSFVCLLCACIYMYTNRKPARCLIDIKNGILTSASHLLFNYYFVCFVIFKIILFVIFVFLSYMLKQNATGRGRSST